MYRTFYVMWIVISIITILILK